jgi:CHASE2 domain-containing sensor protein
MTKPVDISRRAWLWDRRVRGALITLVSSVAMAWLLSSIGIGDAIDRVAQRSYYALRGPRPAAKMMFVAIDERTVAVWGPPPWSWARYQELVGPMRAGGAKLVAMVEPGPRIVDNEPIPQQIAAGVAAGWLIMPTASAGYPQPTVTLTSAGVVDAIDLGDPTQPSITRELIGRLGGDVDGRTLPVNFIGAPDRLPTLPAHHVARGELPLSTFHDRVIVIGLRGERFTPLLPTPVGAMSPAEVHAHAVHAVMSSATLTRLPVWVGLLTLAVVAALGVFVLHRPRGAGVLLAMTVGIASALYLAGFAAFRFASISLEVGPPMLALVTASFGGLVFERRDAMRGLDELRRNIKQRLRLGSMSRPGATEAEILDRFAEALRTHLPATSCLWAPLPPGAWYLELERWYGCASEDVLEPRRDVRRDPWRLPYGSHKPEWATRSFLQEKLGQKSLLVPIAAFGRLLGFWVVNLPSLRAVTPEQLRLLETFADDVAITISQQRLEWRAAATQATGSAASGALLDSVQAARHDAATLAHSQDLTRAALEYLPIGVLSATSWGMIQHCNAAMVKFLERARIESPERAGMAALLAELGRTSVAAAREMLVDAGAGKSVRLTVMVDEAAPGSAAAGSAAAGSAAAGSAAPGSTAAGSAAAGSAGAGSAAAGSAAAGSDMPRERYDLELSRIEIGESTAGERVPTALVLTATRQPDKQPARGAAEDERMGQVIEFRRPGSGSD